MACIRIFNLITSSIVCVCIPSTYNVDDVDDDDDNDYFASCTRVLKIKSLWMEYEDNMQCVFEYISRIVKDYR